MLVQTHFNGETLKPGDTPVVPDDVAARWVENHLASALKEEKKLTDMTAKELYKICIDKGLEVEEKQSKAVYLEALGISE